jgi:hypothetical protein
LKLGLTNDWVEIWMGHVLQRVQMQGKDALEWQVDVDEVGCED